MGILCFGSVNSTGMMLDQVDVSFAVWGSRGAYINGWFVHVSDSFLILGVIEAGGRFIGR